MITPATHGDDDYGVLKIPGTGERMQSCMLVYTRDNFTSFVQHAGSRMTLRQWEEDDHFMVSMQACFNVGTRTDRFIKWLTDRDDDVQGLPYGR